MIASGSLDSLIDSIPVVWINLVIAAVVLFLIVRRTLSKRPLKEKVLIGLILAGIGLLETLDYVLDNGATVGDLLIAIGSMIIGVIIAIIRAHTVRIWREGDVVLTQGSWITAALWVVGLGQHLLLDLLIAPKLGSISLLLYFGLMILAQRWFVRERARAKGLIKRPA